MRPELDQHATTRLRLREMATRIFTIDGASIFPQGWGDYGWILQHGMTSHLRRIAGRLALERTGPYIAPITLPGIGHIVLTTPASRLLESAGLTGFTFRLVEKVLTVELHWEDWDVNAEQPAQFPDSGEPENYILGQPNSTEASAALADLWEVSVPNTAAMQCLEDQLRLDLTTWNGADPFRSDAYGGTLFTERAREWFSENWGSYVDFTEFPAT
jgi:hypothetical protein